MAIQALMKEVQCAVTTQSPTELKDLTERVHLCALATPLNPQLDTLDALLKNYPIAVQHDLQNGPAYVREIQQICTNILPACNRSNMGGG
jgi:hypothetical protein